MGFFGKMMQNVADRVASGLGSEAASGRLDLAAATSALTAAWWRYAGRKGIRQPTVNHLIAFLQMQYGFELEPYAVSRAIGASPSQTVDVDRVMPRIANILLDHGLIGIERG